MKIHVDEIIEKMTPVVLNRMEQMAQKKNMSVEDLVQNMLGVHVGDGDLTIENAARSFAEGDTTDGPNYTNRVI